MQLQPLAAVMVTGQGGLLKAKEAVMTTTQFMSSIQDVQLTVRAELHLGRKVGHLSHL